MCPSGRFIRSKWLLSCEKALARATDASFVNSRAWPLVCMGAPVAGGNVAPFATDGTIDDTTIQASGQTVAICLPATADDDDSFDDEDEE